MNQLAGIWAIANDGIGTQEHPEKGPGYRAFSEVTGIETWRDFYTKTEPAIKGNSMPRAAAEITGRLILHNPGGRNIGAYEPGKVGMEMTQFQDMVGQSKMPGATKYLKGAADLNAFISETEAVIREGLQVSVYIGGPTSIYPVTNETDEMLVTRALAALTPLLCIRGLTAIWIDHFLGEERWSQAFIEALQSRTTATVGIEPYALQSAPWLHNRPVTIEQSLYDRAEARGWLSGGRPLHPVNQHPEVLEFVEMRKIANWEPNDAWERIAVARGRGHEVSMNISEMVRLL